LNYLIMIFMKFNAEDPMHRSFLIRLHKNIRLLSRILFKKVF
jgi:hypothetical protein